MARIKEDFVQQQRGEINSELIDEFNEIFKAVQLTTACHDKCLKSLRKIYDKVDGDEFFNLFVRILRGFFDTEYKNVKNQFVERGLDFCATFVCSIKPIENENNETLIEESEFLRDILYFILEEQCVKSDCIRFHACKMLNRILKGLESEEISEELYEYIIECMLERLKDTIVGVRLQAVSALYRLQDPSDEEDLIINQYIFHMCHDKNAKVRAACTENIALRRSVIPYFLLRLRDVDPNVRLIAFKRASKYPNHFKIVEKHTIILSGYCDTATSVQNYVKDNLIKSWLEYYNYDYIKLLNTLRLDAEEKDIAKTQEVVSLALNSLFEQRPHLELIEVLKFNKETHSLQFKPSKPQLKEKHKKGDQEEEDTKENQSITELNWDTMTYWYYLIEYLRKGGEEYENVLLEVLPELSQFCNYIKEYSTLTLNFTSSNSNNQTKDKENEMSNNQRVDKENETSNNQRGDKENEAESNNQRGDKEEDEIFIFNQGGEDGKNEEDEMSSNNQREAEEDKIGQEEEEENNTEFQYILKLMYKILNGYDFTDIATRKQLIHFVKETLVNTNNEINHGIIKTLVNCLEKPLPDLKQRVTFINEIISEILINANFNSNSKSTNKAGLDCNEEIKQEEDLLVNKLSEEIHNVKLKIHELELKEQAFVNERNFLEAGNCHSQVLLLNEKLNDLTFNLNEMNKPNYGIKSSSAFEPNYSNYDSKSLKRCLNIAEAILLNPQVKELCGTLRVLKSDLIEPLLTHKDGDVQFCAFKCYSLCCIIDRNTAQIGIHLLSAQLLVTQFSDLEIPKLLTAIAGVSDMLVCFGASLITSPDDEGLEPFEKEQEMAIFKGGTSLTSIVQCLVNFMDVESLEVQEQSVMSLINLICSGRVHSAHLLSRMIIKWCLPIEDEDIEGQRIRQRIGIMLEQLPLIQNTTEQLEDAIFLTIKILLKAPKDSPLSEVSLDSIIKFLIQLSKSYQTINLNMHHNLMIRIYDEIKSKPNNKRENEVYAKALLQLTIPKEEKDKEKLNEAIDLFNELRDFIQNAALTKLIVKFIAQLHIAKDNLIQQEQQSTISTFSNTNNLEIRIKEEEPQCQQQQEEDEDDE